MTKNKIEDENKPKQVCITLTDRNKRDARELSRKIFGRVNISGLISFLIEEEKRREVE